MTQDNSEPHWYSKILSISSYSFATIGAIAGVGVLIMLFLAPEGLEDMKAALMSPLLLGGAGYVLGMSLAFLFAPTAFIESPSGTEWMDMVGTKSVMAARIVCATVATFASAFFGVLIWAAATGNF